jgi:hypothetical protein
MCKREFEVLKYRENTVHFQCFHWGGQFVSVYLG